jgi:ActR/RegA family two-component response regulator
LNERVLVCVNQAAYVVTVDCRWRYAAPLAGILSLHVPNILMNRPTTVLIVDRDKLLREDLEHMLKRATFDVVSASSGADGLAAACAQHFDVIVVDPRLPDLDGTDFVRALRVKLVQSRVVIVSGFLTFELAVEAMRLGAAAVFNKPVAPERLLEVVQAVTILPQGDVVSDGGPYAVQRFTDKRPLTETRTPGRQAGSAAERWAMHVFRACQCERDLTTLGSWAEFVGVGHTTLCECCRLIAIQPHNARDFARVLRAVMRSSSQAFPSPPALFLDVSDRRTLKKLLHRAGLGAIADDDTVVSVEHFLERQGFVPYGNPGLRVLRLALTAHAQVAIDTRRAPVS